LHDNSEHGTESGSPSALLTSALPHISIGKPVSLVIDFGKSNSCSFPFIVKSDDPVCNWHSYRSFSHVDTSYPIVCTLLVMATIAINHSYWVLWDESVHQIRNHFIRQGRVELSRMVELWSRKGRSQLSLVNDRSFKHSIEVEQNCGLCGLKICYGLVATRDL
jgi:hypothetical protein